MYIRKKATLKKDIAKKIICAVMVVICVNGILSSCYKAPDYFTTEYCMEQYDETMPNLVCLKTKNRTDDVINNIWFYSIKGVSIDEFIVYNRLYNLFFGDWNVVRNKECEINPITDWEVRRVCINRLRKQDIKIDDEEVIEEILSAARSFELYYTKPIEEDSSEENINRIEKNNEAIQENPRYYYYRSELSEDTKSSIYALNIYFKGYWYLKWKAEILVLNDGKCYICRNFKCNAKEIFEEEIAGHISTYYYYYYVGEKFDQYMSETMDN